LISQGLSSGTLSEGCRKFLQDAYEKWAAENQCQFHSKVTDVQSTVENAVENIFRDVEQASSSYQTKLDETKEHLTQRVGDLEKRLESVAASQLNLCTPVVNGMKSLKEETW
jgi:predicted transposase YbfD/YdcC